MGLGGGQSPDPFPSPTHGGGGGSSDHTALDNIGTKTHAQIDAHITLSSAVVLSSTSNSVAIDMDNGLKMRLDLGIDDENTTLANPTNLVDGMVFVIWVIQAATARTLAFGSKFAKTPTISTGDDDVDIITCAYDSTLDKIVCNTQLDVLA